MQTITILEQDQCLPAAEVEYQRMKLLVSLEGLEELKDIGEFDMPCTVCRSFAVTRIAKPCRHRLACANCVSRMVSMRLRFDDQTTKPITCCICRALIVDFEQFF